MAGGRDPAQRVAAVRSWGLDPQLGLRAAEIGNRKLSSVLTILREPNGLRCKRQKRSLNDRCLGQRINVLRNPISLYDSSGVEMNYA